MQPLVGEVVATVRQGFHVIAVVADQNGVPAMVLRQIPHQIADGNAGVVVERGKGFIQQQHRPITQQCARERDALFLAARERAGQLVSDAGKTNLVKRLDDLSYGVGVTGAGGQTEPDILAGAQMFEQAFSLQQQGYWPGLRCQGQQVVRIKRQAS